jgi:SAM-dependent methyltransferase
LKQAALHTLQLVKKALDHGMILKDATPFNIQFIHCKPVFIDSLSFEKYTEGGPWIAYKQFCETFLAPLALMTYVDTSLHQLMQAWPSGIPLGVVSKLLPHRTLLNPGILLHIHLASRLRQKEGERLITKKISKNKIISIINNLEHTITRLAPSTKQTSWNTYYSDTIISNGYLEEKERVIRGILNSFNPGVIVDLGANDGYFSKIASERAQHVIAVDADERVIDRLFQQQSNVISNIDVMVASASNPTPSLGVLLRERGSLFERVKGDVALALALIHHMVITDQLNMDLAAESLAQFGNTLIIEFPLPGDEKVKLISRHIKDLSLVYSPERFKTSFEKLFTIENETILQTAPRIIYTLKRK